MAKEITEECLLGFALLCVAAGTWSAVLSHVPYEECSSLTVWHSMNQTMAWILLGILASSWWTVHFSDADGLSLRHSGKLVVLVALLVSSTGVVVGLACRDKESTGAHWAIATGVIEMLSAMLGVYIVARESSARYSISSPKS